MDRSRYAAPPVQQEELTSAQTWCLYVSHFLSMWNSRAYEYGAAIFPGDLLPSSLYGIAETICVLFSSSAVGKWVDNSPTRLRPLVISIVVNRITIVICCATWLFALHVGSDFLQQATFAGLLLMGMVVKVSRMSNMLSMERDWIPTMANYPAPGEAESPFDLTHLNTVIRRIDIACKFLSPLMVMGVMEITSPTTTAILLALMSLMSVGVEIWSVLFVWRRNLRLTAEKTELSDDMQAKSFHKDHSLPARLMRLVFTFEQLMRSQVDSAFYYFSTNVWLPSMGVAVLHASVLDWSGTLITWLLNAGFTYGQMTFAKGIGSIFEIGSTLVFPYLVSIFRRRAAAQPASYQMLSADATEPDEEEGTTHANGTLDSDAFKASQTTASLDPIVKTGSIGIFELLGCLCPAVLTLFFLDSRIEPDDPSQQKQEMEMHRAFSQAPVLTIVFFAFLSLSFLGRWVYDLSVTQLTQTLVPVSRRSEFGGAEMAMVAGISLLHWILAAIWHRQTDYKWLSAGSLTAVAIAAVLWYRWRGRWEKGTIVNI